MEYIDSVSWVGKQLMARSSNALAHACCTVALRSAKYPCSTYTNLKAVFSKEGGLSSGSSKLVLNTVAKREITSTSCSFVALFGLGFNVFRMAM